MSLFRNGASVAAAACVILGFGYIVQIGANADPRQVRNANQSTISNVDTGVMTTTATGSAVFGVPDVVTTPPFYSENIFEAAGIHDSLGDVEAPVPPIMLGSPMDECETDLTLTAMEAAIVELAIFSPCHLEQTFVVRHEKMAFSALTDEDGRAVIRAPALGTEATFFITFDNLEEARETVTVPDATQYDRAVLQWRGRHNLQLHAFEFGAQVGDPGHIWSASTQSAELAQSGERGFLMRLGSPEVEDMPFRVEVYTFPAGLVGRDGEINLLVGAVVTETNCGRDLNVLGMQTNLGRLLVTKDMILDMAACDMVGKSIMRDDLFTNLIYAAR